MLHEIFDQVAQSLDVFDVGNLNMRLWAPLSRPFHLEHLLSNFRCMQSDLLIQALTQREEELRDLCSRYAQFSTVTVRRKRCSKGAVWFSTDEQTTEGRASEICKVSVQI